MKTSRLGMAIGWIAAGLVAALNIFAGIMKYVPVDPASEGAKYMASIGMTPELNHVLGIVELVSVILFLIPRTSTVGFVLMVGYMAGVLATGLTHGMTTADLGVIYLSLGLLTVSAYFRNPELLERIRGKRA